MQGENVLGKLRKCKCKVTFWRLTKRDENDSIIWKMKVRVGFLFGNDARIDVCKVEYEMNGGLGLIMSLGYEKWG